MPTVATGTATFVLNPDQSVTYEVTTTGLSGTMAHIHVGAAGVNGNIIVTLAGGPTVWAGTSTPLEPDQVALLKAGRLYVNVHTAANPNGEIRGQIGFAPTASGDGCSADCRSDEICGNGVLDGVTGEACDDGNLAGGDGCDAGCQLEVCSLASTPAPLGTRLFSIAAAGSGSRVSRSATSSIAQNTPSPRTSPITSWRSASSASAGPISVSPIARAFSTTPSDSIASSVATIEAIASGCPE